MQDRQKQILKALISEFIETAEPVGSKTIMVSYKFNVSPATIRSDLADLEKEGFLAQPHTSAGRIPTDAGYRYFVDDLVDYESMRVQASSVIEKIQNEFHKDKLKRQIHDAVGLLSKATNNISFATLPESRTFYLGISNMLKSPEFIKDPLQASQVVEVFENSNNFLGFLESLEETNQEIQIFIGKENLLEQIQSCSLIISKYNTAEYSGFIGVMGPTRMNYAYNSIILEEVSKLLNQEINQEKND
jgi:transcriptional regulator of heat shock response